jgi:probable HAF family extracellular repeat protein
VANSQGAFVISGGTRTTLPDLSSYGGDGFSSATGINNNHQIAETSDTDSGYSHAVMWSNGTINDNGQIVASGSNTQSHDHAFPLTPS